MNRIQEMETFIGLKKENNMLSIKISFRNQRGTTYTLLFNAISDTFMMITIKGTKKVDLIKFSLLF
jgi:hypothetical protein